MTKQIPYKEGSKTDTNPANSDVSVEMDTMSNFKLFSISYCMAIALIMALVNSPIFVQSATLESDIAILSLLKQSIDPITIIPNSYIHSWNFTLDPCESAGGFLGILCTAPTDNSSKRVAAVSLDAAGYDGFLAPAIGNLTELTELSLSANHFRGPIPESIGNLRKLTRLSLSDNVFTGDIPSGIANLKRLQVLDLSRNRLSGPIPPNASGLRRLIRMSLSGNTFSGRIPDLSGLWQLDTLDLGDNQFFGDLPKLPASLAKLDVSRNALSGHITPLRTLQRITTIDLSDNMFSGIISRTILTLPLVVRINVSINHFATLEPLNFPEIEPKLQLLDAHGNQLRSRLPNSFAAFQSLTSLDLSHNRLYGEIPVAYGKNEGRPWRSLFLQANFLIGNLPPGLASGAAVTRGSLANNCLRCPTSVPICRGGQRPSTECQGHDNGSI